MTDIIEAMTILNGKLAKAYEQGKTYKVDMEGRPAFWVDDRERFRRFGLIRRAPYIIGQVALTGFVGNPERKDHLGPYAITLVNDHLPPLGFKLPDLTLIHSSINYLRELQKTERPQTEE